MSAVLHNNKRRLSCVNALFDEVIAYSLNVILLGIIYEWFIEGIQFMNNSFLDVTCGHKVVEPQLGQRLGSEHWVKSPLYCPKSKRVRWTAIHAKFLCGLLLPLPGWTMSIMIPSCNAHAYMKFSKKNFAPYAKNATVKNIITINKYNVGMKSLDRAIIVSDTVKTETSPSFIS